MGNAGTGELSYNGNRLRHYIHTCISMRRHKQNAKKNSAFNLNAVEERNRRHTHTHRIRIVGENSALETMESDKYHNLWIYFGLLCFASSKREKMETLTIVSVAFSNVCVGCTVCSCRLYVKRDSKRRK